MPRPVQKALTEEEKFKIQEQQEQELTCVQRQYALLEKDRQLFTCGFKLGRLNKVVNIFKREYRNIDTDLEVATAPFKKRQDARLLEHLSKVIESNDFYAEEVKKERQYIQEIDGQIRKVEKEVVKLRTMQISDRQHEERIWAARKTVEQLMNTLDVQNKKFGTICAKNRNLKLQIKFMLWERDVFMKIWNKMINKLVLGKKFMMDLIEQATIAYDQREEWVSKLQALRVKAHYDFIAHTQEMRELRRKRDDNMKLTDFFGTKCKKRIMRDLLENETLKRLERQKIIKDRLKQYRQYLNDILEFTKETTVETIARKYYIQEAENFSFFIRINDFIGEMEGIGDELEVLQNDINDERILDHKRLENRNITLKELETKLEEVTDEVDEKKKEFINLEQYIENMLNGIDNLFKICRCDQDPILNLLGNGKGISIYNVFLYIEMIEKMIHEALAEVYSLEKDMYDKKKITNLQRTVYDYRMKGDLLPLEKMVETNPCPLCISHEFVSDVIDSVQYPFTREHTKSVLKDRLKTPEYLEHLHNVSKCFLPESRDIISKRYQ